MDLRRCVYVRLCICGVAYSWCCAVVGLCSCTFVWLWSSGIVELCRHVVMVLCICVVVGL